MFIKSYLVLLLVFGLSLTLFGCNRTQEEIDPVIVSITVNNDDIKGDFLLEEFDLSKVRLVLTYDDGNTKMIYLTESMISNQDINRLNQAGTHTITVTHDALTTTFTINIIEELDDLTITLRAIHQLGTEEGVIDESYEEWLESVRGPKGEPGTDGREVVFQVADGYIQWQYQSEDNWHNLIELASLIGPKGDAGLDGREIVLQVSDTHIQWQYSEEETWQDLISLALLIGPKGDTGEDGIAGREVIFQVADGYIQWQYQGEDNWHNLIELASLIGPKGDAGLDGREIVLQVSDTHIQWQYSGEDNWHNLISLALLIGPKGDQGVSIVSMEINTFGELVVTFSDETSQNLGQILTVFTVQFKDYNGYVLDTQILVKGTDAKLPNNPSREGHTFKGWSVEATNVTEDLVIFAEYEVNTYTVTFDSEGGSEIDVIGNVEYGTTIELPIPVLTGYVFHGWYIGTGATAEPFYNTSLVKGDITLHARWELALHLVRFFDYDDTFLFGQYVTHGMSATSPKDPVREGYTFIGWDKDFSVITDNMIVKAEYSVNSYTIVYYDEDGMTILDSESYDFDSVLTKPADPLREGYTFTGWYTDQTWSEVFAFSTMPAEDVSLYAKWELNTYTVSFETFGGENIEPIERFFEETIGTLPEPSKSGYLFDTWYLDAEYTVIFDLAKMPAEDLTLYAKWNVNPDALEVHYHMMPSQYNAPIDFELYDGEVIVKFSIGYYGSGALTSLGRVFVWGSMTNLMCPETLTHLQTPYPVDVTAWLLLDEGETIVDLIMSAQHSLVLTSNGRLLTWGGNHAGQLGDGTTDRSYAPVDITANFALNSGESIISVASSGDFNLLLTSDNRVYTWGLNTDGQLGNNTQLDYSALPIDITAYFSFAEGEVVASIEASQFKGAVLTSHHRVFMWGSFHGWSPIWLVPTDMTDEFGLGESETIIEIKLGKTHNVALSSQGRVFTWGHGQFGQLGTGLMFDSYYVTSPSEITAHFSLSEGETIVGIEAGGSHSLAYTSLGQVYTWGSNENGQLGDGTREVGLYPINITSFFDDVSNISYSALGYATSLIVFEGDNVFIFGTYTGTGTNAVQDVPVRLYQFTPSVVLVDYFDEGTLIKAISLEKNGYIFSGWYTDLTFKDLYDFNTIPYENEVLYGYWIVEE